MKKYLKIFFVIMVITLLFAACAVPTTAPNPNQAENQNQNQNQNVDQQKIDPTVPLVKPVGYLVDENGEVTYGIYEFKNGLGQHCTVIADLTISASTASNAAPTMSCTGQ